MHITLRTCLCTGESGANPALYRAGYPGRFKDGSSRISDGKSETELFVNACTASEDLKTSRMRDSGSVRKEPWYTLKVFQVRQFDHEGKI